MAMKIIIIDELHFMLSKILFSLSSVEFSVLSPDLLFFLGPGIWALVALCFLAGALFTSSPRRFTEGEKGCGGLVLREERLGGARPVKLYGDDGTANAPADRFEERGVMLLLVLDAVGVGGARIASA